MELGRAVHNQLVQAGSHIPLLIRSVTQETQSQYESHSGLVEMLLHAVYWYSSHLMGYRIKLLHWYWHTWLWNPCKFLSWELRLDLNILREKYDVFEKPPSHSPLQVTFPKFSWSIPHALLFLLSFDISILYSSMLARSKGPSFYWHHSSLDLNRTTPCYRGILPPLTWFSFFFEDLFCPCTLNIP
jgi:hypothetical protein